MPRRRLSDLTSQEWDVVVIGGGILGAGIARDAALRGLSVALVEQADFGSGTSSRSTKLAHGGFRYLEQGQLRLVAEACRERERLLRLAPHLVHSLSFLLPVYRGDPRPLWKIRIGMTLYRWLAGRRAGGEHRTLSPQEARQAEPALSMDGLLGAVAFHDCQMDDARLCLETILDAMRLGAACANYCRVTGIEKWREQVTRVTVRDEIAGGEFSLRGRAFVNAAGPWVDRILGLLPDGHSDFALSPTKGVHLVLPPVLHGHGLYFQSRRDDRMVFLLPYGEATLLGTTDTNYTADPADATADQADVDYLFERLREVLPDTGWGSRDVITSFAGVRPLLRASRSAPSHRPREHRISQHGDNLVTIAGGKYTTYRAISEQVVDAVARSQHWRLRPCQTAEAPLVDRRPHRNTPLLCTAPRVSESDIAHACQEELAVTLEDVMRRRTRLALSAAGGPAYAEKVAGIMARELHWSAAEQQRQLTNYLAEWSRQKPV